MKKIYTVGLCSSLLFVSTIGSVAFASEENTPETIETTAVITLPMPLDEPTDPSIPVDLTEPTDPSTPVDPTEPTDPSTPVEPTEPTDPSTPIEPTEPTDPSTPTDPTEPTEPSTPTEPTEPSTPDEPTTPTEPEKPVTPETPTKPSEPTTPSKPVDTVPSPESPVETGTGSVVIGVDNGNPILQQADGTTTTVSPESIGATKQADGTLVVKDSKGTLKVLPHTGEKEQAALSVMGVLGTLLSSFFLVKRKRV